MKKVITLILALSMLFSFTSCKKSNPDIISSTQENIIQSENDNNNDIVQGNNNAAAQSEKDGQTSEPKKETDATPESDSSQESGTNPENDYIKPDNQGENGQNGDDVTPINNFKVKNIDMLNFYSVKKVLTEKSLLPTKADVAPEIIKLSDDKIYYYEIDRYTPFTITMLTYFTIELNDENGFLAQRLGGTGLVEVAITVNNLQNMITFKRGDKYYSCLWNSASYNQDSTNSLKRVTFSTHKYFEGFNIVKNLEQENYEFTVHFEGAKVSGIECARFKDDKYVHDYSLDDITLNEDFCFVMFIKQSFTIDELEGYFDAQENHDGSI